MKERARISIIGESILVEGVLIGLEENPSINVQRIQDNNDETLHLISEFKPDAIIYPLGQPGIVEFLSQIRISSSVRYIGLDSGCNQVLVADSRLLEPLSMTELERLLVTPAAESFSVGEGATQFAEGGDNQVIEIDVMGMQE